MPETFSVADCRFRLEPIGLLMLCFSQGSFKHVCTCHTIVDIVHMSRKLLRGSFLFSGLNISIIHGMAGNTWHLFVELQYDLLYSGIRYINLLSFLHLFIYREFRHNTGFTEL